MGFVVRCLQCAGAGGVKSMLEIVRSDRQETYRNDSPSRTRLPHATANRFADAHPNAHGQTDDEKADHDLYPDPCPLAQVP